VRVVGFLHLDDGAASWCAAGASAACASPFDADAEATTAAPLLLDSPAARTASGSSSCGSLSSISTPTSSDFDATPLLAAPPPATAVCYRPPQHLLEFLQPPVGGGLQRADKFEPPIYVGFGSCVLGGADALESLVELVTAAAEAAGVRVVLATGWAGAGGSGDGEDSSSSSSGSSGNDCGGLEVAGKAVVTSGSQQQRVCCIEEVPHPFIFPR